MLSISATDWDSDAVAVAGRLGDMSTLHREPPEAAPESDEATWNELRTARAAPEPGAEEAEVSHKETGPVEVTTDEANVVANENASPSPEDTGGGDEA